MNESSFTQADWESLVAACRQGDIAAHLAVDFAAKMPTPLPAGPGITYVVNRWALFTFTTWISSYSTRFAAAIKSVSSVSDPS